MCVGDLVKVHNKNFDDEVRDVLWEIIDFETRAGQEFVILKHPDIGGLFSFHKEIVLEIK